MKSKLCLLIGILSLNAQAFMPQTVEITCDYQYETYSSEDEVTDTFTAVGKSDLAGNIYFSKKIGGLPSYFFPPDRYGAYWHYDSKITFNAKLAGKILTYDFEFKNYVRNYNELKTVNKQNRVLDMTEHFDEDEFDFEFDDGDLISYDINKDDWVNESHVEIDDCELKFK